ncbi:hypothetical protein K8089_08545 [Aequorivita sp. F47161]|jgi:hypothetical protein|uniref:Uncharacterized protein n=1 Tax=Aequorivita vitellina TaxID=2874475 RepID=A0A9X1QVF8_9FLAO|nr:hypothetical protein [Aequorivita vitellina]MCG2419070.1 hypothetical protein [Aequorivita vitellina]MCZ4319782.1 hypothetical protein [Aequorivita viscosa]
MKNLLGILFLFMSFSAFSQDPFLQKSNPVAEKEAIQLTQKYVPELGLTGEQQSLFQQKVEEFLIRRYKIEAELSGKEKLNLLYKLQQEETAEMNDILTRPQLEVYKKIKPKFQPIETIKTE